MEGTTVEVLTGVGCDDERVVRVGVTCVDCAMYDEGDVVFDDDVQLLTETHDAKESDFVFAVSRSGQHSSAQPSRGPRFFSLP